MSYYNDVYLQCGEQAFKKIKQAVINDNIKPTDVYCTNNKENTMYYLIWLEMKQDILTKANNLLSTLAELDSLDDEGMKYRLIGIGEDNKTFVQSNDDDYLICDMDVTVSVDIPLYSLKLLSLGEID